MTVKYLLDTHTLLWFLSGDSRLSAKALSIIKPRKETCYVSIATLWEMAVKSSLDKLKLHTPFANIKNELTYNDIQILPISFDDTITLISLPLHHRDPFDRIIISQSINHTLTLITRDEDIKLYRVKTLW